MAMTYLVSHPVLPLIKVTREDDQRASSATRSPVVRLASLIQQFVDTTESTSAPLSEVARIRYLRIHPSFRLSLQIKPSIAQAA